MFDPNRSKTHKIYEISDSMLIHSFSRNCTFKYTEDKKGNKIYNDKKAELKIEKYQN